MMPIHNWLGISILSLQVLTSMSLSTNISRIAIGQLRSVNNKHTNLISIARTAGWAKRDGAKMLFLPECLGFMGDSAEHTVKNADPSMTVQMAAPNDDVLPMNSFREALSATIISCSEGNGEKTCNGDSHKFDNEENITSIITELRFIAQQSKLWISGGGVHTAAEDPSKIYNTHVIIDETGQIKSFYHKIHLFDVSIPGKVNLKESKTTSPGQKLVVCDSPIGKLGLSICYDMRFPEMYVELVQRGGADVCLVPSAFTVPTGLAHWHALLKSRAIESQCYVIAAAQVGRHNEKRKSYGHSLAYDPWGELLVDAGGYDDDDFIDDEISPVNVPSIVTCDIDLNLVQSVRERMPIQQHRTSANFTF